MIKSFSDKEIKNLAFLIQKILGAGDFIFKRKSYMGEWFFNLNDDDIFKTLKSDLDDNSYLKLYSIINFYYSRWIAYNLINESDDFYSDLSADNQLLLALTSIIDLLANPDPENIRGNYSKRFIIFLKKYLSKDDIKKFLNIGIIYDSKGKKEIKDIKSLVEYIYEVRSYVVHRAELGGMFPYNIDLNSNKIIRPKDFRKLLWKAILKSFNLSIDIDLLYQP